MERKEDKKFSFCYFYSMERRKRHVTDSHFCMTNLQGMMILVGLLSYRIFIMFDLTVEMFIFILGINRKNKNM